MNTLRDLNCENKKVLIRVDFNVPLNDKFEITDSTRIKAALPTIEYVLNTGGSVILMSHLGRPKNGPEEKFSLKHLVKPLSSMINRDVKFSTDCVGNEAERISSDLKPGEVLLLENLRFHPHETAGSEDFAKSLSIHGDIYVNDAFGTAHRAHASTAIIARFFPGNKYFGFLMQKEIDSVSRIMQSGEKPFTAIMGGAKVSSKIGIINRLMDRCDHIIIGGGMTYTFIKAKGGKVGSSLVEDDKLELSLEILEKAKEKGVKIHLPVDTYAGDKFANDAEKKLFNIDEVDDGWMGLDIGPESVKQFNDIITDSKTILWNGPMGVFEMENFEFGTKKIAESIVNATSNGAFSLIGGGDSVAAINKFNLADKVSYISTGGGALLEYLEGIDLPGIAAISND